MTGDTAMLTLKTRWAKAASKLALSATVSAFWMAATPAAAADDSVSAARARALQACSGMADEWDYAYRACMTQHGQQE